MNDRPASTSPDGTLRRTESGGVIRFERRLPFTIDEVWDAITNPARLADWWLPFDADITVDLRAGGKMVFTSRDQEPIVLTCEVLIVEPPTLLEHTHPAPGSRLRWELASIEHGCLLRLTQFVTDVDDSITNCHVVGLHASLARLEPCLAGHPIPWDWDAFAQTQAHYASVGLAPAPAAS